jgi:hypothetical protein
MTKTFIAKRSPAEPLTFTVETHGVTEDGTEETRRHDFRARPTIPGLTLMKFMARMEQGTDVAGAILDFTYRVLLPEDRERFDLVFEDPDWVIDSDVLSQVITGLAEEYGGRPTEPGSP